MPHLYWSCDGNDVDAVLSLLRELGAKAELTAALGPKVIHLSEPNDRVLQATPGLILQKRLKSAALVASPLAPENLYVAAEWWGKLVVQRSELALTERLSTHLRRAQDFKTLDLVIFDIQDTREPPDDALFGEPRPEEQVRADPETYYGRFARGEYGGANALFAAGQEAARARGLAAGTVLVGSPATFGYSVDDSEEAVVACRGKGLVTVQAFGFTLSNWPAARAQCEGSAEMSFAEAVTADEIGQWTASGLFFGLAIALKGVDDPPVVIPIGSIYQQPVMGSPGQNLAVAKARTHMIGAGAQVPIVLPAWCLNPSFSAPNGPMSATPLVAGSARGTQHEVWQDISQRYRRTR